MIILSTRTTWITLRKLRSIQATPVLAQTMIMVIPCTLFQPARYNGRHSLFLRYRQPLPMTDYDSPWKEMLENYFPAFMAFFFPAAHRDIDWERGYESLDKELQQIVRDAELGKRLADKLMKVWRRGGEEVKTDV